MEQSTKFCSNCEKDVPESKFILHERYCVLNVKKCSQCKEVINIEDEQEHIKEFHSEISCQFCSKAFPKQKIDAHIQTCNEKLIECQYCRLQVPFKEKIEHEYLCGSKTEICPTCKKYIPIREYDLHIEIGCCQEDYLNNHIKIEPGKPKEKKHLSKIVNEKQNTKDNDRKFHNELKQQIEQFKKDQLKEGNQINSPIQKIQKKEDSRNEGVVISSVKVEIPQNRLNQMQKPKVDEKTDGNRLKKMECVEPKKKEQVNLNSRTEDKDFNIEKIKKDYLIMNRKYFKAVTDPSRKDNSKVSNNNNRYEKLNNNHQIIFGTKIQSQEDDKLKGIMNPHEISNKGIDPIVKKMPYTKRIVESNNSNSTNHVNVNEDIMTSNIIPNSKISPSIKNHQQKILKQRNAGGIFQKTGEAITNKNNESQKMKYIQNNEHEKEIKREKEKSKKSGKKNKFDPIKFADDFLPDEYIEESGVNLHNIKNNIIEPKEKPKQINPLCSVEEDILKHVIELSKAQK